MSEPITLTNFDPTKFLVVPQRRFADLTIGDIFRAPSRTLTDAHATAFQSVSADNHPVHYDAVWAARHGHSAPLVHGLQVLAFSAPGATLFPRYIGESFIAFTELSCKFLKRGSFRRHPVFGTGDHRSGTEWGQRYRNNSCHDLQPTQ